MESDKISKCCCDLFKIKKRQVIVSLRVITKVFLPRHSNVSLENGKKPLQGSTLAMCSLARMHFLGRRASSGHNN